MSLHESESLPAFLQFRVGHDEHVLNTYLGYFLIQRFPDGALKGIFLQEIDASDARSYIAEITAEWVSEDPWLDEDRPTIPHWVGFSRGRAGVGLEIVEFNETDVGDTEAIGFGKRFPDRRTKEYREVRERLERATLAALDLLLKASRRQPIASAMASAWPLGQVSDIEFDPRSIDWIEADHPDGFFTTPSPLAIEPGRSVCLRLPEGSTLRSTVSRIILTIPGGWSGLDDGPLVGVCMDDEDEVRGGAILRNRHRMELAIGEWSGYVITDLESALLTLATSTGATIWRSDFSEMLFANFD